MSDSIDQAGGKTNSALRSPAEAAKALAALRGADPLAALNDLSAWLDSAKDISGDDEKARIDLLSLIQDASEAHLAMLLAQFLARPSGSRATRESKWNVLNDYLRGLTGTLYITATRLLNQAGANQALQLAGATAAARSLHACRRLVKSYLFHYLSVPPKLWQLAYGVHGDAENFGCATTPVRMQLALKASTSVTQELLRLLMLQASSPQMMAPEQIEVADRVVEQLGGDFTLRPRGVTDQVFRFDPASDQPPHRAAGQPPDADFRYFGAGMAFGALERINRQMAKANSADIVNAFGRDIAPHVQVSAVQHLLAFWGEASPYSPPARSPATGALQVVHGYAQTWQHLSGGRSGKGELTLVEDGDGPAQATESWPLQDTGGNELGAEVPQTSSDWARCGAVVGVSKQGEDARWLGMIRAMHAEPEGGLRASIAILSREPQTTQLLALTAKDEESVYSTEASRQFAFSRVRAIILADGSTPSQKPNFMLPAESWKEGRVYEATIGGASRFLRSGQLLRRGDDYVRATFEWVEKV